LPHRPCPPVWDFTQAIPTNHPAHRKTGASLPVWARLTFLNQLYIPQIRTPGDSLDLPAPHSPISQMGQNPRQPATAVFIGSTSRQPSTARTGGTNSSGPITSSNYSYVRLQHARLDHSPPGRNFLLPGLPLATARDRPYFLNTRSSLARRQPLLPSPALFALVNSLTKQPPQAVH